MILDRSFINTIINETYVTLSSDEYTFEKEIKKEVVTHASVCDNVSKLGTTYSMFSVRSGESIVYVATKAENKRSAMSQGTYTQAYGGGLEQDDCSPTGFEKLLATRFFTESEIDAAGKNADAEYDKTATDSPLNARTEPVEISKDAARAVLYSCVARWQKKDDAINVAVPLSECTDERSYSGYVFRAMQQLYRYFPAALRAEAGFCSHLSYSRAKEYPRFYICFIPENEASTKTVFLTGNDAKCRKIVEDCGIYPATRRFLEHIMDCANDEERQKFLSEVSVDVEGSGYPETFAQVDVNSYYIYGMGMAVVEAQKSENFYSKLEDFLVRQNLSSNFKERVIKSIDGSVTTAGLETYIASKPDKERFKAITNLSGLAKNHPERHDVLWQGAVDVIGKTSDAKEKYDSIRSNYSKLAEIDKARTEELLAITGKEYVDSLASKLRSNIKSEESDCSDLDAAINAKILGNSFSKIDNLKTEGSRYTGETYVTGIANDLAAQLYEKYFVGLIKNAIEDEWEKANTPAEIKALIDRKQFITRVTKKAEEKYRSYVPDYSAAELLNALAGQIETLKSRIDRQDAEVTAFINEISSKQNSIAFLQAIEQANQLSKKLEKSYVDDLVGKMVEVYKESFTLSDINIRSIADLKASDIADKGAVGAAVTAKLISAIPQANIRLDSASRGSMIKLIGGHIEKASTFGVDRNKLSFNLGGENFRADELLRLLNLDFSGMDEGRVNTIVANFASMGIYGSDDVPELRNAYERCDFKQSALMKLLAGNQLRTNEAGLNMFLGGFADSAARKYQAAGNGEKSMEKALEHMGDFTQQSQNNELNNAFYTLVERHKPREITKVVKKGSPAAAIILSITTLAAAGGAGWLFMQLKAANENIDGLNGQVSELNDTVAAKEASISELEGAVAERDASILAEANSRYGSDIQTLIEAALTYENERDHEEPVTDVDGNAILDENGQPVVTIIPGDRTARLEELNAAMSTAFYKLCPDEPLYYELFEEEEAQALMAMGTMRINDADGRLWQVSRGYNELYGNYISLCSGSFSDGAREGEVTEYIYCADLGKEIKLLVFNGSFGSAFNGSGSMTDFAEKVETNKKGNVSVSHDESCYTVYTGGFVDGRLDGSITTVVYEYGEPVSSVTELYSNGNLQQTEVADETGSNNSEETA